MNRSPCPRISSLLGCSADCCCCSVTKSGLTLHDPMDCSTSDLPVPHHLSEFAQVHVLLNQGCHPTVSSSVVPFSICLQSFPASGSSPMSQLFASGGQSIGSSASASVFPVVINLCVCILYMCAWMYVSVRVLPALFLLSCCFSFSA